MKNLFYLFTFSFFIFSFYSCNDESPIFNSEQETTFLPTNLEGVNISVNGNIIQFEDENHFEKLVEKLSKVSLEEQQEIFSKINFNLSLNDLYIQSERELEELFTTKDTLEFLSQYKLYRNQYNRYFLFDENINDDSNLSPQLKVENSIIANLVNQEGSFYIKDKLINMNIYYSYKEKMGLDSSLRYTTNVNSCELKSSNRKIRASASKNNSNEIVVNFTSQSKMWYGWKNGNTEFAGRLWLVGNCNPYYSNNGQYNLVVANPITSFKTPQSSNYTVTCAKITNPSFVMSRGHIQISSSGFDFKTWELMEISL